MPFRLALGQSNKFCQMKFALVSFLLVATTTTTANAFVLSLLPGSATTRGSSGTPGRLDVVLGASTEDDLRAEADSLLRRAQELRATLPAINDGANPRHAEGKVLLNSPWRVPSDGNGVGYRLELDIGREDGTWMDPRWGASGRRISLTLDVLFSGMLADKERRDKMVKDNFGGKSSDVYHLESASAARLRNGFDKMPCRGGAYRVDSGSNGKQTARFYVDVDGTPERGSPYGYVIHAVCSCCSANVLDLPLTAPHLLYSDVSIPRGLLYFSLPCFGGVSNLSGKKGIVTVRQMGWHTGWRREESRIVGTVYASPIERAIIRDKF